MMIRTLYIAAAFALMALPSDAQNECGETAPKANAALVASQSMMEQGDSEQAIEYSQQAVDLSATCFEAHLSLLRAYYLRFDHVDGLAALGVSRQFRKQMKIVRKMQPDHIEARIMEIRYLGLAPGIAGGSRSKAKRLAEELAVLDASAAYRTRVGLARQEDDPKVIIALLNERPLGSAAELDDRSGLVRTLILSLEEYEAAEQELAGWDQIVLPEEVIAERLLLRAVLRVRGNFEHEEAADFLNSFIDRRDGLPDDAVEPAWIAYAYLGDARRAMGDAPGAREAYNVALASNPKADRAKKGLRLLD